MEEDIYGGIALRRWVKYNANPAGKRVGDCTVRAISRATGHDWDTSYLWLSVFGFQMKNMPSGNCVWGAYLESCGFIWHAMERYPERPCTVAEFCREHPHGLYVLGCDGHVVTAVDGEYWDSWDSGNEAVIYYWER